MEKLSYDNNGFMETGCDVIDWIHLAYDRAQ